MIKSDLCTFCNEEIETTKHLLYECSHVQKVWDSVKSFIREAFNIDVKLELEQIIFNDVMPNPSNVVNFVILAVKYKLYALRCQKTVPKFQAVLAYIKDCKQVEKYNAIANGNVNKYVSKWENTQLSATEKYDVHIEEFCEQYINQINLFESNEN